jgi:hypothetical protein
MTVQSRSKTNVRGADHAPADYAVTVELKRKKEGERLTTEER